MVARRRLMSFGRWLRLAYLAGRRDEPGVLGAAIVRGGRMPRSEFEARVWLYERGASDRAHAMLSVLADEHRQFINRVLRRETMRKETRDKRKATEIESPGGLGGTCNASFNQQGQDSSRPRLDH